MGEKFTVEELAWKLKPRLTSVKVEKAIMGTVGGMLLLVIIF